jgi:hypothetical protein
MTAKWLILIGSVCFWGLGLLTVVKLHSKHDHIDEQPSLEEQLNNKTMKRIEVRDSRHDFVQIKD